MNEHLREFLDKYLKMAPPPGAVLINAPWGAGKTFLTKRVLRDLAANYIYVSVNGVSTYEELVRRTVLATYPVLQSRSLGALGSLARSALGVFRFQTDLTIEKVFDLPAHHVLVFDDVERATLDVRQTMGFFNALCEQDENHVIILSNEDEIGKDEYYGAIKEKTIYFTVRVRPDVTALLGVYKRSVQASFGTFLEKYETELADLFATIGSENLRTFRNALSDFEPIFVQAEDLKLSNETIFEALRLFLVYAVAVKEGILDRSDLRQRTDAFTAAFHLHAGREETPLSRLQTQHSNLDLYAATLDNELLEAVLFDGVANCDLIRRSLAPLGASDLGKGVPAWRRIWYYMQNDERLTQSAIDELTDQMNRFEMQRTGEILHAFGALFELAQVGVTNETSADVLKKAKAYADELAARQRFDVDVEDRYGPGSAYGLGFLQSSNPKFREAADYLFSKTKEARILRLKGVLAEALQNIETHSLELRKLLLSSSPDENLGREPALHEIAESYFVEQLLKLTGEEQLEVYMTIGRRLEDATEAVFSIEEPWARAVIEEVRAKAKHQSPLRRARLLKMSDWLTTALDQRAGLKSQ